MSTLRRFVVAAALAAGPVVPVATLTLALPACGGKSAPKPKKPKAPKPVSTDQLLAAARAAAKAGDIDGADAKYRQAEKADLSLATVKEHVEMLLAHRRAADAVAVASSYHEAKPGDADGSLVYANALIEAGDAAAAIEIGTEVVDLQADAPGGYEVRGRALLATGKIDEGLEDLRKATELDKQSARYLMSYGIGLLQAKRADEAALQLLSSLSIDDKNAKALMYLGLARAAQLDNKEAHSWLLKATKAKPDYAEAWAFLAITQNQLGDDLEAEISAQKATSFGPDVSMHWYVYGEMLRINKKPEEAMAAYQKAADTRPSHPKAAAKYALVLYQSERFAEAEVYLTDAIGKDPGNHNLYLQLGWVYGAQKKYKMGVESFEKYLELASKDDSDRGKAIAEIKALKKRGNLR